MQSWLIKCCHQLISTSLCDIWDIALIFRWLWCDLETYPDDFGVAKAAGNEKGKEGGKTGRKGKKEERKDHNVHAGMLLILWYRMILKHVDAYQGSLWPTEDDPIVPLSSAHCIATSADSANLARSRVRRPDLYNLASRFWSQPADRQLVRAVPLSAAVVLRE